MNPLISNVLMQPKLERTTMTMTDAVIERPQPKTLIEKLEARLQKLQLSMKSSDDSEHYARLCSRESGYLTAFSIVKQHSDWVSVDERLPHPEEMLTNHYEPKEFYEIILKTGELLIASYTHMKNDGNNEILFMDCTIVLTDGKWELLDDGFGGYQADEVAYWKPIQPPSEVQDDM